MKVIMVNRLIQVVPVKINGQSGWVTRTVDGSRAGPKHAPYSTPEEAVEAAEAWFVAFDLREQDTKDRRIIAALERGRYFIRARNVQSTDTQGNPITVKLFSGFLLNGNATSVIDRPSFIQAVIDMEILLP